jgi:hypothetical protein
MMPCTESDDGRHRWRFTVSRMAGTPHYACDYGCGTIALPTGDGWAEDYAHLGTSGEVVRDDGRTLHRVTMTLGASVDVHVLAVDDAEARDRAQDAADDAIGYAEDAAGRFGVYLHGPPYVIDVEEIDAT